MKKIIFSLIAGSLITFSGNAQEVEPCGTNEALESLHNQFPQLKAEYELNKILLNNHVPTVSESESKKATMKNDKGDISMTVYFTEKIKNQAQKEFMGLKGFPLQYKMAQQSMTVEMMASEISEQTVPNSLFDKSDGYKDISESDLQNMMGGGKL